MARRTHTPDGTLRTQVPFVVIPQWVLDALVGNSQAIHLYGILQKYANKEGKAWPKRPELIAALGKSSSALDRAIASLKEIQALDVRLKHRPDGAVLGADYFVLQIPPALAHQNVTGDEKVSASPIVTGDEKAGQPFRQKSAAFSSPVTTVLKEELDPCNQIQEQERSLLAMGPRRVFTGETIDPTDPCEQFRAVWNELAAPDIRPCLSLTPKRRRLIRAALATRSLDAWRAIIERLNRSSFCRGEKGWVATMDWLIATPDAAVKVLEGQFDDVARAPRGGASDRALGRRSDPWMCPHADPCSNRAQCDNATLLGRPRRTA